MVKQKKYLAKFKTRLVLEALKKEKTVPKIAAEHNINLNNLFRWKNDFLSSSSYVFEKNKKNLKTTREKSKNRKKVSPNGAKNWSADT
ncbi:MAG: transposase [Enterococcus sp.]|nr:transposase [Enterococcus sp.]